MIRLGFLHSDLFSWKEPVHLNIAGRIVFEGRMGLGVGSTIEVARSACLELGGNLQIGARTKLFCRESIKIGNNTRMAWEAQVIDTNFHYIKNIHTGEIAKDTKAVVIGENNWLGNRCSIMQGTHTPNFTIIASNSLCNRNYSDVTEQYSIIGGLPAKLIGKGYIRVLDKEEAMVRARFQELGAPNTIVSPLYGD